MLTLGNCEWHSVSVQGEYINYVHSKLNTVVSRTIIYIHYNK